MVLKYSKSHHPENVDHFQSIPKSLLMFFWGIAKDFLEQFLRGHLSSPIHWSETGEGGVSQTQLFQDLNAQDLEFFLHFQLF